MIVLDARKMKAFECLQELGTAAGRDAAYLDTLWGEFLADAELMGAFMYYLDHHSLSDSISCEGYGLTDLYFYSLRMAEMDRDIGKNGSECDKEGLVLDTFLLMSLMRREPERYKRLLGGGPGMDIGPV